jgi:hypothetical protein
VEEITGRASSGYEFTDDNTVGDFYEDKAPGIRVDYIDDVVVRLLLTGDGWEVWETGLHPNLPKSEVERLYADVTVRAEGEDGGMFISYDENYAPIPYNEFSPYVLEVSYNDDDTVAIVFLKHTESPTAEESEAISANLFEISNIADTIATIREYLNISLAAYLCETPQELQQAVFEKYGSDSFGALTVAGNLTQDDMPEECWEALLSLQPYSCTTVTSGDTLFAVVRFE